MTFINALANYIQTNSLGTQGTSLFIGFMPTTTSTLQSVLTEYTGGTVETMRTGIPMKKSNMQVKTHGAEGDYATPRTRIEAIQNLLVTIQDQTLSGVRIVRVLPLGTINALGQNDNQEFEFTANFEVVHE
jgi:hypothetical protein